MAVELTLLMIVLAVPLALLLSWWLLRRYRQAVLHSMLEHSGNAVQAEAPPSAPATPPPSPLRVVWIDAGDTLSLDDVAAASDAYANRGRRTAAFVYAVAGCVQAAVITAALFMGEQFEFYPLRTLTIWALFAWPIVPTVLVVVGAGRLLRRALPLMLVAMLALLYFGVADMVGMGEILFLWAYLSGLPSLMVLLIGNRRVRAVAPILTVLVAWLLLGLWLSLDLLVAVGERAGGLNIVQVVGLVLMTLLFFAVVGWLAFRLLARHYARKGTSDQRLWLNTWWLLYALWEAVILAAIAGFYALWALVAFALFTLIVFVGLLPLRRSAEGRRPARLLLLRVFGFRARIEHLSEDLESRWRYLGSIQLIAGTDLATANMQPHEFYAYMSGQLSRQYIRDAVHLQQQLDDLDNAPDPDGRFRVNEFFCHDDTWQMTLRRLVDGSEAILMDLRGFTPQNQGVLYELRHLINVAPLSRLVLIGDGDIDRDYLAETLGALWHEMAADSPNRQTDAGALHILSVDRQGGAEIRQLMRLLCAASSAGGAINEV